MIRQQSMLQRLIAWTFIIVLTAALMGTGKAAFAEGSEGIMIQSSIGFNGQYKEGIWTPVQLSMTNTSKDNLKGEVVVSVNSPFGGQSVDYVVPAELPADTEVEIELSIPGTQLHEKNNRIRFFKGSYKSGDEVKFMGNNYLSGSMIANNTIGVIASDPDTLNFMPSLNLQGYNIYVLPLTEDQLPSNPNLLNFFNVLVLNDTATSGWDNKHIEAIEGWVRAGGTLMLSGGAGYSKTAQAFQEIAPFEQEGTANIDTKSLAAASGEEWKVSGSLTVSTGSITQGNTVLSAEQLPIAIQRQVGLGKTVYVAFDPALEPFASWSGSEELYARLLQDNLTPAFQGNVSTNLNNTYWFFDNIVNRFPSIKTPNFIPLLLTFVIYTVVVAPFLYLLLRKLDRREWTWWVVPSLAVLTGIAIFFYGSGDRRNMVAHTVSIAELSQDGGGTRSGVFAVYTPTGGTIKAGFDQQMFLTPLYNDGGGQFSDTINLNGNKQVITDENGSTMKWNDVSYSSTRKAWFEGMVIPSSEGNFKIVYHDENGAMMITVTNTTKADMSHVAVLMNGDLYPVGSLKPNEERTVAIGTSSINSGYYYGSSQNLFPTSNGNDEFNRHRELLDNYLNQNYGLAAQLQPRVIGFSTDNTEWISMNGSAVQTDNLTLWVQKIGELLSEDNGRYTVPAGLLKPVIGNHTMQRMDSFGDGNFGISSGELEFEYQLPNVNGVKFDQLLIAKDVLNNNTNLTWQIWNEAKQQWDKAADQMDPASYITASHSIRMKLIASTDTDTRLPLISLKGVATP
ncbi:hypothetical protein [Paenibacillus sp. NEAU-GSW1]|uniref:hypothetical protein n=1 Tax=Paenibacillus sp. NEAU-GSW1 TaxID=2682486 RepID=UPI0012E26D7A|nr:hypothetical protein [Paenibacillus sp. NEAU-GSW1]MUT66448.1 hypothetical protein [Paenibacillus sp. NEAU-GSW1]